MTIHEFIYEMHRLFLNNRISIQELNTICHDIHAANNLEMDKNTFVSWIKWDMQKVSEDINYYRNNKLYYFVQNISEKEFMLDRINKLFEKQLFYINYPSTTLMTYYSNIRIKDDTLIIPEKRC